MITREQSDKIFNMMLLTYRKEFYHPITELAKATSNLIDKAKFHGAIKVKQTGNLIATRTEQNENTTGIKGTQISTRFYQDGVRVYYKGSLGFDLEYHQPNVDSVIYEMITRVLGLDGVNIYRYYSYSGEQDEWRQKFNALLNGPSAPLVYKRYEESREILAQVLEYSKSQVEEFSRRLTKAYNEAKRIETENDAQVLRDFGLIAEAVEPENFEVNIKVVKVNRGKKSTKKGKK